MTAMAVVVAVVFLVETGVISGGGECSNFITVTTGYPGIHVQPTMSVRLCRGVYYTPRRYPPAHSFDLRLQHPTPCTLRPAPASVALLWSPLAPILGYSKVNTRLRSDASWETYCCFANSLLSLKSVWTTFKLFLTAILSTN